ncbi:MAG: hypothetical protein ACFB9M_06290 [Myxococcota bacterium]
MPLDHRLVADCPYGPEGLLLDAILEVDRPARRLVARMPTSPDLPITSTQRAHPVLHPRHVSAGLMIHMTGIMGYVHVYTFEGLRHRDGWTGYGVRIHDARFRRIAHVESPMVLETTGRSVRRVGPRMFARYAFRFFQDETPVFESEQSAIWIDTRSTTDSGHAGAGRPAP